MNFYYFTVFWGLDGDCGFVGLDFHDICPGLDFVAFGDYVFEDFDIAGAFADVGEEWEGVDFFDASKN